MQMRYSGSAKIVFLDRRQVRRELKEAVAALVRRHPEVERVLLFGSVARDEAGPGSDADVLVVVGATDAPFLDRPLVYELERISIPVDLFVYTRAELERMQAEGNLFIRSALADGVALYERP